MQGWIMNTALPEGGAVKVENGLRSLTAASIGPATRSIIPNTARLSTRFAEAKRSGEPLPLYRSGRAKSG